jgi:ribosomal-protein-alanine acetyltransferase
LDLTSRRFSLRHRPATAADIPALIQLELAAAGAAHWSREQYERMFAALDDQVDPRHADPKHVITLIESNEIEIRNAPPALLGFVVVRQVGEEWELENLAVAKSARRRGLATMLMEDLVSFAQRAGIEKIFLEVRESNQAARALYQKSGFTETGRRKNYYEQPSEDAILYCRDLG